MIFMTFWRTKHSPYMMYICAIVYIFTGQGQFGKVYTAVNIDSGELLAMKQITSQHNDHKTIKAIADEIKIFEGILHPNLVRYYGVEVHRVGVIFGEEN